MIEGFNIRCTVGGLEVLRSPRIVLALRRRAIVSRCELDVPDTDGSVQAVLAKKQPVRIRFGHRGEGGTWHDWSGTVSDFQMAGEDAVRVVAVGREQALLDPKSLKPCMESPPMSSPAGFLLPRGCQWPTSPSRRKSSRISSFPG